MSKINCNLIVAGPATGKTYLALNDKRFVDLDGERQLINMVFLVFLS